MTAFMVLIVEGNIHQTWNILYSESNGLEAYSRYCRYREDHANFQDEWAYKTVVGCTQSDPTKRQANHWDTMISNFEWKCGWFCGPLHAFEGFRLFSFRRTRCKHQVKNTDRLTWNQSSHELLSSEIWNSNTLTMLRNRIGFLPKSGVWMCMWAFELLSAPPPPPPVYEAEDDDVKRQSDFKILTRSVVFSIGELNFWVSPSSQFETGIFLFLGFWVG